MDLRHNADRHFDMALTTNRIKFLPSGRLCPYGTYKDAICGQYLGYDRSKLATNDRDFVSIATWYT